MIVKLRRLLEVMQRSVIYNSLPSDDIEPRIIGGNHVSQLNMWKSNPPFFEMQETEGPLAG
jgi:hypothetical protein